MGNIQGDPEEPGDHALGRSQGGYSTKIHVLCDGHGHPLHFHLTPGQAHETTAFIPLLVGADERVADGDGGPVAWPVALAGDKGYRADWIDDYLTSFSDCYATAESVRSSISRHSGDGDPVPEAP